MSIRRRDASPRGASHLHVTATFAAKRSRKNGYFRFVRSMYRLCPWHPCLLFFFLPSKLCSSVVALHYCLCGCARGSRKSQVIWWDVLHREMSVRRRPRRLYVVAHMTEYKVRRVAKCSFFSFPFLFVFFYPFCLLSCMAYVYPYLQWRNEITAKHTRGSVSEFDPAHDFCRSLWCRVWPIVGSCVFQ